MFSRRKRVNGVLEPLVCKCAACGRVYAYDHRKGHSKTRCNTCRGTDVHAREARKRQAVEYKGGRCQLCGYAAVLRALTFHHVDPATKRFSVAGNHMRSWTSVKRELDKTVLLCIRCHFEVEDGYRELPREVLTEVLNSIEGLPRYERRRPGRPRTAPDPVSDGA